MAAALSGDVWGRDPQPSRASLTNPDHLLCMPCSIPRWIGSGARWLASCAFPRRFLPCPCSLPRYRGGSASTLLTFEACSSFTRVTACIVAHPPYVGFIARLRPGRLPGSDAHKLSSSTNNLLEWVLPPLVICAVEAHPVTPFSSRIAFLLSGNASHWHGESRQATMAPCAPFPAHR